MKHDCRLENLISKFQAINLPTYYTSAFVALALLLNFLPCVAVKIDEMAFAVRFHVHEKLYQDVSTG